MIATEIKQYFIDSLFLDFGLIIVTEELENWPALSWTALQEELSRQEINIDISINRDWKNFFYIEKEKYLLFEKLLQEQPFMQMEQILPSINYN